MSLPAPPEPGDTSPIDLADWLTMIEPAMTDLSDSSGEWWDLVIGESKRLYTNYQLHPLATSQGQPAPSNLPLSFGDPNGQGWRRIPATVKEELIATKALTPLHEGDCEADDVVPAWGDSRD